MEFKSISWRTALQAGVLGLTGIGGLGCQPTAVSSAGEGTEYARYLSSLYNEPAVNHGPRTIEFPVNVAVAQVGQTTLSGQVLDKMRKTPDVFRHVGSLPADPNAHDPNVAATRDPVPRMQALARDQGADYLLICGSTVETHTRVTNLSGFDLTIVGAYIVPSRQVQAKAQASAALIDVRSGTVVMTVGAQDDQTAAASAVEADAVRDKISDAAADKSLLNAVDQFIAEAHHRIAEDNAIGSK